jgi:predicted transglutaminase-like cysteine proteinase
MIPNPLETFPFQQRWNDFLDRTPDQNAEHTAVLPIDQLDQVAINKINFEVDKFLWNRDVQDFWCCRANGDCEDKSLEKRRRLNSELGIDLGAMSLTICLNKRRQVHAVLCLRTDAGDYILDNENRFILPWEMTSIRRWLYRQTGGNSWESCRVVE